MRIAPFRKYLVEKTDQTPGKSDTQQFLMPSDLPIPVFLMCPPFSLDASTPNNALMKSLPPKDRKTNTLKAVDQFLSIYNYVTKGAMVYLLPAKDGLGDLPYVANLGIILPHLKNNNTVVVSNYKSEIRTGETHVGVDYFRQLGYDTVVSPPYFEGEADLKFLNGNNYCGAYGIRTNITALKWFEETYDMNVIPIKMVSEKMYHLDCVAFPLEAKKLIAVTSVIDKSALKRIEKITEIIDVDKKAGEGGITNCVRMGNVIMNGTTINKEKPNTPKYELEKHKNELLEKLCSKYGYDPVFFDISEFDKSGAAMSCLVMRLNYPDLLSGD